ncbi:transport and Golgi organization protein 6 [Sitodiplosis mosellana]|uniref:transport and Golgi organization protein 6 n=1 Tax=Sitodiplosis mosellana TaxID=263140 RepID=UPI002444397D|nr:transport and Golgi organization protein 6 [Sitodiplosis mosellana]
MPNTNSLKSLISLIGSEENYSCNVSIRAELDTAALNELSNLQKSRTPEECGTYQKILYEDNQCPRPNTGEPSNWTYATTIFEILLQICDELESNDDFPISVNEAKKVHIGIRKSIEYGLKPFLLGVASPIDFRLPFIVASTKVLLKIANNKFFPLICTRSDQHLLYTDVLSSIFMIIFHAESEIKSQFEQHLVSVQTQIPQADYFKILFLIQGSGQNRQELSIQQITLKQLMQTLHRPGSFSALCEALLPSITSLDQDEEIAKKRLHCCAVISSIVAKRGHKKQFYHQIIDEIHEHLLSFIRSNKSHQLYYTDVGVQCLSKLYSLQLGFICRHITDILLRTLNNLADPNDLIAGAILCEANEFIEAVHLLHLTFCASGPSDDTLPSEILKPYMPMLFQIHHLLSESSNRLLKHDILAVIVRCLSNREKLELCQIVEWILYEEYNNSSKCLHRRVNIKRANNEQCESITFNIAAIEVENDSTDDDDFNINSFLQPSISLVNVLKQCNHNTLIYNVFLHLLQMFSDNWGTSRKIEQLSSSSELLGSECELKKAIEMKFKRKYSVIHALNELILFKPFHGQFAENQQDIVSMLDKMLNQQIEQIKAALESNQELMAEDFEEILVVILSIVGDFMQRIQNEELKTRLETTLGKLRTHLRGDEMKTVMGKLDIVLGAPTKFKDNSKFLEAMAILSETHSEPYTKVYGVMNLIKLINERDEETCLNAHIILALAMKLLKEEDSYIFLNCIKLLITLVEILEETVLETLIAEYHFDIDADAGDIDFKLKIGETVVKVTQGLGEMCYKYKSILINCYLRGAYNPNDEFRTSNMSNLGVIMRILSYQVHHFFQEVMLLIQNTVQFDKYLPTRRAAALVLTDLLNGMQNLEQYQDYLLPIYRILKNIAENDADLHIQIHARNGLDALSNKIKEALTAESKMEKEIRIFGVKNDDEPFKYK